MALADLSIPSPDTAAREPGIVRHGGRPGDPVWEAAAYQ